jgi:hypothetical protein
MRSGRKPRSARSGSARDTGGKERGLPTGRRFPHGPQVVRERYRVRLTSSRRRSSEVVDLLMAITARPVQWHRRTPDQPTKGPLGVSEVLAAVLTYSRSRAMYSSFGAANSFFNPLSDLIDRAETADQPDRQMKAARSPASSVTSMTGLVRVLLGLATSWT